MSDKQKEALKNKVPRWYRKMAIYKVVIGILTPIAGGEVLAFFAEMKLPAWVHIAVGVSAVALLYIKTFAHDVDGDGYID